MQKLNDSVSISGQIGPNDLQDLADAGVQRIVCARPDGEGASQPKADAMAEAASAHGLELLHLPVIPGEMPSEADAQGFAAFARGYQVHAYCAKGPRALVLASLAGASEGQMLQTILEEAQTYGLDLSQLTPVLRAYGAQEA